jgi:pimeloyl-ACP methyl ester carboxylesterase
MDAAATTAIPGYTPVDIQDLLLALTAIDGHIQARFSGRTGARALVGYSMGAYESLFLAAFSQTHPQPVVHFDRVLAIDSPVRLVYGMEQLDAFYQAPLAWPANQRTEKMRNTLVKVLALGRTNLASNAPLPFDETEAKFLVGLAFRFDLRDVIFDSQCRYNTGILSQPIRPLRREPLYQEILRYSYLDYWHDFVTPYYQQRGINLTDPAALEKADDLRLWAGVLGSNRSVRLIANRDDFLLASEDLAWLTNTFDAKRLTLFERGGHLGNLRQPEVQRAVLAALKDLRPWRPPTPDKLVLPRSGTPGMPVVPSVP